MARLSSSRGAAVGGEFRNEAAEARSSCPHHPILDESEVERRQRLRNAYEQQRRRAAYVGIYVMHHYCSSSSDSPNSPDMQLRTTTSKLHQNDM